MQLAVPIILVVIVLMVSVVKVVLPLGMTRIELGRGLVSMSLMMKDDRDVMIGRRRPLESKHKNKRMRFRPEIIMAWIMEDKRERKHKLALGFKFLGGVQC